MECAEGEARRFRARVCTVECAAWGARGVADDSAPGLCGDGFVLGASSACVLGGCVTNVWGFVCGASAPSFSGHKKPRRGCVITSVPGFVLSYLRSNSTVLPLDMSWAWSSFIGPISISNDLSFQILSYFSLSME